MFPPPLPCCGKLHRVVQGNIRGGGSRGGVFKRGSGRNVCAQDWGRHQGFQDQREGEHYDNSAPEWWHSICIASLYWVLLCERSDGGRREHVVDDVTM